jgi:hypothetical protein
MKVHSVPSLGLSSCLAPLYRTIITWLDGKNMLSVRHAAIARPWRQDAVKLGQCEVWFDEDISLRVVQLSPGITNCHEIEEQMQSMWGSQAHALQPCMITTLQEKKQIQQHCGETRNTCEHNFLRTLTCMFTPKAPRHL